MTRFDGNMAEDRNLLMNLGSRLLGATSSVTGPSTRAPSSPRSLPINQTNENTRPTVPQTSNPLTGVASPAVQQDVTMTDVREGPSLWGGDERLDAARAFANQVSGSRAGGRSSRSGRDRMISRPSSSTATSPRPNGIMRPITPARTTTSSAQRIAFNSTASTQSMSGGGSGSSSIASSSAAPIVKSSTAELTSPTSKATTATPAVGGWNAFAANERAPKIDSGSTGVKKVEVEAASTHAHPTVSVAEKQVANPGLTDVTNTGHSTLPPHLRAKAAGKAVVQVQSNKPAASFVETDPFTSPAIRAGIKAPANVGITKPHPAGHIDHIDRTPQPPPMERVIAPHSTELKTISSTPVPVSSNGHVPAKEMVDMVEMLRAMQSQLQNVVDRVKAVEEDGFHAMNELQTIMQAEERRKFLGTDSFRAPFVLGVNCDHTTYAVQVNMELKVSELVRRVCTKANIKLGHSSNPRVTVEGHQVGHGMTLGELGITKGCTTNVSFTYNC